MFRVDLHAHTWYSGDSPTSPGRLVQRARAAGLDRIAVTDHNTIDGAFAAQDLDPERVIVGEEITCSCGTHLIGLFLQERIPKGVTIEDAARAIRRQGGVVYAPHPIAYITRPAWRAERVFAVADVVEVFNSRGTLPSWNRKAASQAEERRVRRAAGSDAHMPWEIGRAFAEMPPFHDAASFLESAAQCSRISGSTCSVFLHFGTILLHGARKAIGRNHGVPLRRDGRPG